jgi:Zn-finger nucleic acid-binding protein
MACPKCSNEMMQVVKHGITIDTCATCGGVWLDKGELGELMNRISQAGSSIDQEFARVEQARLDHGRPYHDERHDHHGDYHDDRDRHDYKHKKRSLWDIFD